MEGNPNDRVYYTIKRSSSGQWEINELGFDRPIVSFSDRNEALDYARRLTDARRAAEVTVQRLPAAH